MFLLNYCNTCDDEKDTYIYNKGKESNSEGKQERGKLRVITLQYRYNKIFYSCGNKLIHYNVNDTYAQTHTYSHK